MAVNTVVRMPVLLTNNLTTVRPLKAVGLSLNVSLRDRSQGKLTVSYDESPLPMRSFVDVYTHKGKQATYRVTNTALSNERGRVYTLTHAIDTLRDSVYQMQGTFEGVKIEFLETLFSYQKERRWRLGYVEDAYGSYKSPNINYTKLSDLFSKYLQDNPDVYPSYDFTTTPWTVHILKLPTEVSARFSLTRNADTCNVVYDDKNMCNRLYLSVNTPEQVNGITKYNTELRVYENAASIAQYGIIEKTASVKTDEITGADADAWASAFLEKYAQPEVNITVDGYELYKQTGEIYDEASVGKRATVSLPEYGTSTTQRIESVQYPDVLTAPTAIVVSLATKQKTFTTAISNLEQEVEKVGGVAGGAALAAADAEEVTTWSLIMQKVQEAVDGTGITALWETGIIIDAETGAKIYSISQGFDAVNEEVMVNRAAIDVNSKQISLAVEQGQNNASAITANAQSITALSQTVNENGEQISGALIRLDGVEAEVEILAQKQVSLDQYENRLATVESSVTTNAESITALSQTVDENGNQISGALLRLDGVEGEVEILAQKQVSLDQYENRLTAAEAAIIVNADAITQKVSKTDFNALGNRVSNAEAAIEVNADAITAKVGRTEFNALGNRVSNAEAAIEVNADAITAKVSRTDFNALGERVSEAEAAITVNADAITSKVSKNGVISEINQTSETVKISASRIALEGLVTASQLQTAIADVNYQNSQAIETLLIEANNTDFNYLNASSFTLGNTLMSKKQITMGPISTGQVLAVSNATLDLSHSHEVSVSDDGTVTLGAASVTGGNFKIADTKVYKDGVSAAKNSVTLSSAGWINGVNTVAASNGKTYPVSLPAFSTWVNPDFDENHKTRAYFYTASVSTTLASAEVDASSVYEKGYEAGAATGGNVTLSSAGWINGVNTVTASNGASYAVELPDFSTSYTSFNSQHKATVYFSTASVSQPLKSVEVDASSVYSDGAAAVTLSSAGWINGVNSVKASNGKAYNVNLPTFDVSGGETFVNKKTTVFFSTESVSQPLKSVEVDATAVYEQGLADGAGNVNVTLSASGWAKKKNTVTAYNGATILGSIDILPPTLRHEFYDFDPTTHIGGLLVYSEASVFPALDIDIDASGVYTQGVGSVTLSQSGWDQNRNTVRASNGARETVYLPEFAISGGTTFDANHTTKVYFTTESLEQPVKTATVDASSVYDEGYAAGWAAAAAIFDMSWASTSTANSTLTIVHAGATPERANAADTVKITAACEISNITNPSQGVLYAYAQSRAYANVNGEGAIQRAYANKATQAYGSLG